MSGGKSKKQTVGYRYGMGLHFGICHGPVDYLSEIRVGDRTAHDVTITGSEEIYIDEPSLFGGDKREGGIQGYADVLSGSASQVVNEYLQEQLGLDARVPAFRGLYAVLYKGGLVTSNNPYIKPWAFKVGRIKAGWGGEQETSETEYSNSVLYPWGSGGTDPRACENDHEYRIPSGTWRSTLEAAIADVEASIGASISSTLIGWSKDFTTAGLRLVSPYTELDPEEREVLYLHFNRHTDLIDPARFFAVLEDGPGDVCGVFPANGISPGDGYFWWQYRLTSGASPTAFNTGTIAGVFGHSIRYSGSVFDPVRLAGLDASNNCTANGPPPGDAAPSAWTVNDELIEVRRKVRAPDDPCSPRCSDSFPDYPPDATYCVIGATAVKRGGWFLTAGNFKVLQNLRVVSSSVVEYPLGPALPDSDPNYSDEDYWTAQYDASVLAGTSVAGKSFDASGTGNPAFTYPQYLASAYVRSGGSIEEGDPWEPDLAQIDADMNPAHIIYQCISNPEWGMGYPEASIDADNFAAVAQALYDEEFGLSFQWTQQQPVEEFIGEVLNHCGGVWYADPRTGLFSLALIRDDYSVSDLRVFDESNIIAMESYQRPGYGELVNQIVVSWTDVPNNKTATTPPLQDPACIQAQGCVIGEVRQYPGITKSGLAQRVALRDLIAASTPLASLKLRVNREAWDLIPGKDVIVVNWDKLGIVQLVCRVLKVDRGTLQDGSILLEVAEDVFGLPSNVYVTQEEEGWVEPDVTPDDIEIMSLVESPYWDLARNLSAADLDYTDVDAGYVFTLAARSTPVETAYNIWSRVGAADYEENGSGIFAPTALLNGAIDQSEISITLDNGIDLSQVAVGDRCLIGEGRLAEFCEVLTLNTTTGVMTVSRAVLDTTPQEHADNTRVWFVEDFFGVDPTERATTDEADVKLTAVATGGETDLADATEQTITMAGRFGRPYPPGNVRINGQAFPTVVDTTEAASEGFVIAWSHRDRTTQDVELVAQTEGDIGPEVGTTYTVELYNDVSDVMIDSESGLTGTTLSLTATDSYPARLEIYSVRDGIESWQRQIRRFSLIGTDVFITEDGDYFITEDGQYLAPE